MNYFCKTCKTKIADRGLPYYELYFCLFDLFLDQTLFVYQESQISSSCKTLLKLLESDGLLITHEVGKNALIAVINLDSIWYHEPPGVFCFLEGKNHLIRRIRKRKGRVDKK